MAKTPPRESRPTRFLRTTPRGDRRSCLPLPAIRATEQRARCCNPPRHLGELPSTLVAWNLPVRCAPSVPRSASSRRRWRAIEFPRTPRNPPQNSPPPNRPRCRPTCLEPVRLVLRRGRANPTTETIPQTHSCSCGCSCPHPVGTACSRWQACVQCAGRTLPNRLHRAGNWFRS